MQVEVEVVLEDAVHRSLREDVGVGDTQTGHEREIDYINQLGDDVRGLRELILWHAFAVRQVLRRGGGDLRLCSGNVSTFLPTSE